MRQHTLAPDDVARCELLLVHTGVPEARARTITAGLLAAWGPDHPSVIPIEGGVSRETLTDAAWRRPIVLAVIGAGTPLSAVSALGDHARLELTPVVALVDPEDPRAGRFARDQRLIVEPWTCPPARLRAVIETLWRRQPVLLARDEEQRVTAAALGHARRELETIHQELELAASIQREFIPTTTPDLPGLNTGVFFRPACAVSGDVFEVRRLDEEHAGIFLGDAVGHGAPAGMLALVLSKELVRTEPGPDDRPRIVPPGEALGRLNDEMAERSGSRFATAVYAVVHLPTGRVRLSSAGHPPPLLRTGGKTTRPETLGPLLGVFPDAEFPEVEFVLRPGDGLVMFSDGFETAFHAEGAGAESLRRPNATHLEMLSQLSDGAGARSQLDERLRAFKLELNAQAGSLHQADDLTAIVVAPSDELPGLSAA